MTRVAAFKRDREGMARLKAQVEQALASAAPAEEDDPAFLDRLLLWDILTTQREVLSAMLAAMDEPDGAPGVLTTQNGVSARVPARPMPQRDLWFERVWKKFREETDGTGGARVD